MYRDRYHAGQTLAEQLAGRRIIDPLLLAIPRGGVVVAVPIAERLGVGIQVLVTRKVGHPGNAEVAIGACMPDGSAIADKQLLSRLNITEAQFQVMAAKEYEEIGRRLFAYTGSVRPLQVEGRTVIIIDDGIATGYTVRAAILWLQKLKPDSIIVAVPVAPADVVEELRQQVEVICPILADRFMAVGMYYQNFVQTSDDEVVEMLRTAAAFQTARLDKSRL